MSAVWHLLKFEIRRLAAALVYFFVMLVLWFCLLWRLPNLSLSAADFSTRSATLHMFGGGVLVVLVASMSLWLGQGHTSRRIDAVWRTRPIRPVTVLVVKVIAVFAILTSFCVVGNLAKVVWGFEWGEAFSTGWSPLLLGAAPAISLVMLMTMAGNWPRLLAYGALGVGALMVGSWFVGVAFDFDSGARVDALWREISVWRWGHYGNIDSANLPGEDIVIRVFATSVTAMMIFGLWLELKTRCVKKVITIFLLTPAVFILSLFLWPISTGPTAKLSPHVEYQGALEIAEKKRGTMRDIALQFQHPSDSSRWLFPLLPGTVKFETAAGRYEYDLPVSHFWIGEPGWRFVWHERPDLAAYESLGTPRVAFMDSQQEQFMVPTSVEKLRRRTNHGETMMIEVGAALPSAKGPSGTVRGNFDAVEMGYEKTGDYLLWELPSIRAESQVTHVREISIGPSEFRYKGEIVLLVNAVAIKLQDKLSGPNINDEIDVHYSDELLPRYFLVHPREEQAIEIDLNLGTEKNILGWQAEQIWMEISFLTEAWPPGVSPITKEDLPRLRCIVLEPRILRKLRVHLVEMPWQFPSWYYE